MQRSRPLVWSLLLFGLGLMATALLMWHQRSLNIATIQMQFSRVASENANQIIERIYRFQYGLKGIQGAILGADARHLSESTFRAFHEAQDVALEFNGARGFGYMTEAKPIAGPPRADNIVIPFFEPTDDAVQPQEARAFLRGQGSLHAAAIAWSRQAPTISTPLVAPKSTNPSATSPSGRDLMLLIPARPQGLPVPQSDGNPVDVRGWVYVLLSVDATLVDLSPNSQDYSLNITDVTPGDMGGLVFASSTNKPKLDTPRWQSTREILGRRWLMEAHAEPRFGDHLNLTSVGTVGWLGMGMTTLLTALFYAFLSNRQRQSEMHRQEAQLAAIVRHTSDAIVSQTPDGRVLSWNNAAEHIFGITATEIIGRPWSSLLLSSWDQAEDAHMVDAVMAGHTPPPFDTVLRAQDGTPIDVSMSMVALTSPEGHIDCISRTIHDNRERKAAEARLRELAQNLEQQVQVRTGELASATRHLQSVLDGMPSMIGYWDHDLINRFANRAYTEWLKCPQGEVTGLHMEAVLGMSEYEAIRHRLDAVLTGHVQIFDHTEPSADQQSTRHLQTHYLPDMDSNQVRGFYVLIHDITELTESQQKLAVASRQSEALLKTLQQHAIYSVADRKGNIIDVNDAFCHISGYSRQELMGQNHRMINSGVHPQAFWTEVWRTISKGHSWRGEICNRAKDGSLYWVDSIIAPFRGADGRIEKYISLRTDITARRLAEDRLRASSEGFLERAGQMAGVGGWELDLATGEMLLTRQTRAIFALAEDSRLTLEESLRYFQSPSRELLRNAIHDAVRLNQGWDLELPFVNAAGNKLWVRTVGGVEHVVVHDDGKPGRLVGALQDVTTKHLTEQALLEAKRNAEAASSAKTEFLANMSHEIRTPLNAVIGMTHLLGESLKNLEQREWVSKIQAASKSLLTVLNDVLDLSKIEAGELSLEDSQFSLRKQLKEIESLFIPQSTTKGVGFSIEVPNDAPDAVQGDHFRIRQVLINLLSNAFKFTEKGSVTLTLRVLTRSDEHVHLRFNVTDTGLGMSEETVSRLFEPFTQADASTTRRFGGTGLGLSIVRRLVTLMGGEVGVNSEEGKGSQFWFTLPLSLPTANGNTLIGSDHLHMLLVGSRAEEMAHLAALAEGMGWLVTRLSMDDEGAVPERANHPDLIVLEHALSHSLWWESVHRHWQDKNPDASPPILTYRNPRATTVDEAAGKEPTVAGEIPRPWSCTGFYNAALEALSHKGQGGDRLYASSNPEAMGARWLDHIRILVVDDSDINLEVALRLLKAQGASVATARNGQEALQYLERDPTAVDAVLMDIQMPVMDGKEAARRIRQDMGLTELPIIALTAGAMLADRQRVMEAGMNDFASKPLEPQALVRVIRRHVEQARGEPILISPAQIPSAITEIWPLVEGIDSQSVASEFGQDREFYRGLLKRLLQEHGQGQINWEAPLTSLEDAEAMQARLHKLSGSAAVLYARSLATLAKKAELQLKNNPGSDMRAALQAVGQAMAELEQSAQAWLAMSEPPVPAPGVAPPIPVALEDDPAFLDWITALASQNLQALERFPALAPSLRQALTPEVFESLQNAVQGLDFGSAIDLLRQQGLMGTASPA